MSIEKDDRKEPEVDRPIEAADNQSLEPADTDDPKMDEDAPSTDVSVLAHVHFLMTGSFPLRVADLFFADDGLYIAEYTFITPFFGLMMRKQHREERAMKAIYDRWGLDAVLVQADFVIWHSYDNIDHIDINTGGRFVRPKITIYPKGGRSHAYRVHDRDQWENARETIVSIGADEDVPIEEKGGLGIHPGENIRRFFWRHP